MKYSSIPALSLSLLTLNFLILGAAPAMSAGETTEAPHHGPRVPVYNTVEGEPIETRPPEKADDAPLFAGQTRVAYHASTPYKVMTLADGLRAPWSMAFLPGGKILFTERLPGALRILDASGHVSAPLEGLSVLAPNAQVGLLDVVLDPHFASNHRIFFTWFEWADKNVNNTNVGSARLDPDSGALHDVKAIFKSKPNLPAKGDISAGTKTGGRIAIGPDGYLYVTMGDRDGAGPHPWDVAQKLDNDLGKVIRITVDGKPAPGNPFAGKPGALPEIWAYGQRSQEGLVFDNNGRLWETENGPRGGDELNLIVKGANYGWPVITHGVDYSGKPVGDGIVAKDGMTQPVYYWDPVIAPSGTAFYDGDLFPHWKNSILVGGLRGMLLDRLTMSDGKVVAEEPLLTELHTRIRDVRVGPDGAVYVLTDTAGMVVTDAAPATSKLLKIVPSR